MLSREEQECLSDGYIRNNCIHSVPVPINRLIQTFWAEHIWFTLKGNKLKQFLNANIGDIIRGKAFKIGDITGYTMLFPNGRGRSNDAGFVQYLLELTIPSNVKAMAVHFELYCLQSKAYWKQTVYFCGEDGKNGLYLMMGYYQMKLSECKDAQQLDFVHYADILSIEYKEDSGKQNYYKQIKMNHKSEYEWNINQSMIQLFKNGHRGKWEFSPSFNNDCWALFCAPNGHGLFEYFFFGLRLLSLPHQIKEFEVKIILDIEPNIYHYEKIKKMKSNKVGFGGNSKLTLNDMISKSNNSAFSMNVKIEIVGVWIEGNEGLKKIKEDEMDKYGIVKS